MLKTLLTLLTAAVALPMLAQEQPDTIVAFQRPADVTVIETGASSQVRITEASGDVFVYDTTVEAPKEDDIHLRQDFAVAFPFDSSSKLKAGRAIYSMSFMQDLYAGVSIPLSAPGAVNCGAECGILRVFGLSAAPWLRGPRLDTGIGFRYQGYGIGDGMRYALDGEQLVITPAPEGAEKTGGSLGVGSITFPFMLSQKIYKGFGISLGAVVNLNTYASAHASWKIGNKSYSETVKGLNQRFVTVDWMVNVNIAEGFGVYFKYAPTSLFQSPYGPDMSQCSAGISVNF